MLREFIQAAMARAQYKIIEEDGTFFGEIPEIEGTWGSGATLEECRNELESAVEGWLLISFQHQLPIPILDGIDLNPKQELASLETG